MPDSLGLTGAVLAVVTALVVLTFMLIISMVLHTRKMKESENRFRLLFDRVFDGLVLTNEAGNIIDLNQSACTILGVNKAEMTGQSIQSYVAGDDLGRLDLALRKTLSSESYFLGELTLHNKTNSNRYAEGALAHFEYLESHYLIISFRDITERKRADRELKNERQMLYKKNVALKEILQHIETEKTEIKKTVADKIEQVIMPLVEKLVSFSDTASKNYYNVLVDELRRLSGLTASLPNLYYKLSLREIEICKLIKAGASTKDIAKTLNLSIRTVNKHRQRIRIRFDIVNKDINLASFLKDRNA